MKQSPKLSSSPDIFDTKIYLFVLESPLSYKVAEKNIVHDEIGNLITRQYCFVSVSEAKKSQKKIVHIGKAGKNISGLARKIALHHASKKLSESVFSFEFNAFPSVNYLQNIADSTKKIRLLNTQEQSQIPEIISTFTHRISRLRWGVVARINNILQ